jgi:hypothetical protein
MSFLLLLLLMVLMVLVPPCYPLGPLLGAPFQPLAVPTLATHVSIARAPGSGTPPVVVKSRTRVLAVVIAI